MPWFASDAEKVGYEAGHAHGLLWDGPNGDGSMGALSLEFIRDRAEEFACGRRFAELTDGPTVEERGKAGGYVSGFWDGREEALSA